MRVPDVGTIQQSWLAAQLPFSLGVRIMLRKKILYGGMALVSASLDWLRSLSL